jgi:hypothetical protein
MACRNTSVLTVALALCLAAAGCGRLPALDSEEALAVAVQKGGLAPQTAEAAGPPRVDKKKREAVIEFRVAGMARPVTFAARFTHHKYRGWTFDSFRDRYGDWVKPELFAADLEAFRAMDTEQLVFVAALAFSAHAVEKGGFPKEDALQGGALDELFRSYAETYGRAFWFAPPPHLPRQDLWGRPMTYNLDIPATDLLPFDFEIRSPGPNGEPGDLDDISFRQGWDTLRGKPPHELWFAR